MNKRGHKRGARFIGVLGDAPRQRNRVERRGHHQLLPGCKSQPGVDRDFGEAVEIFLEFRCLRKLPLRKAVVEFMPHIIARGTRN